MSDSRLSRVLLGLAVAGALGLGACTGDSPEQLLASAKSYLDKGDHRAAAIQLKTALQARPDWPDARFLLGKALLDSEQPVVAAVELRKALDLKHSRDQAIPLLATALLQQGQHKALIEEFAQTKLDDKAAQASLKTTLAWAYLAIDESARADASFKEALDAVPGHVPAQVAQARQMAVRGDRAGALKAVDVLVAAGSADADAWTLKGDLLAVGRSDVPGAIAAYRKAIEANKTHIAAHAGIVTLLLSQRDTQGAATQLAELEKVRPGHPTTRFFQAQLALEKRDYKAARELVQQLLKRAPNHPMVNQLAGAIELASGSQTAARAYLTKVLQVAPSSVMARRLLAGSHLRSGESARALTLLEPLIAMTPPDPVALAMAGEAQMQKGDLEAASALLSRAVKADPNANNQTALARTRLRRGDAAGALSDLEQIAAADPGTVADLELINTQLRRRDFKAALAAIDTLDRKDPNKALPWHLRGAAHLGLRDSAQARAAFEKALSVDAAFFPSAAALATLDLQDKKPQEARGRFETMLKAQPGHLQAMIALAQVHARSETSKPKATEVLAEAVRLHPSEPTAHLALVAHHLSKKEFEPALSAAQRAEAALPDNPAVLDALGRAQAASGQTNQSISTFNRLAALRPGEALAHLRLADTHIAAKNTDAAIQTLKKAVELKPDSPALLRLFALQIQAGKSADALALARDLQKRHPEHSLGYVMEGDALRSTKNNEGALGAYRRGMVKTQGTAAATRTHALLLAMGKQAEAAQFAQTWQKDHPKDALFAVYQGDEALARRDLAASEAAYRRAIELQPDNVVALNNVAWIMAKQGKPGALALAEKANGLRPNQPTLMDTWAFALAADKQIDKALELQKKALELAPENPTMKLGLARLYVQAGQKVQARELLEPLDKLGDKFRDHAEVKSLMAAVL
jgi:putative PEP-CTERM system TPR-repeat lipoprotein